MAGYKRIELFSYLRCFLRKSTISLAIWLNPPIWKRMVPTHFLQSTFIISWLEIFITYYSFRLLLYRSRTLLWRIRIMLAYGKYLTIPKTYTRKTTHFDIGQEHHTLFSHPRNQTLIGKSDTTWVQKWILQLK